MISVPGAPPPLPHDNFLHLALLPHPWKKNSRGIPAGVTEFQLKWPESQRHPLLILPKQAQRRSVTGPALHSPGFGLSGPDVSPRGSGRWSSGPASPGLSGTRDPSQAPPPPPAGGPLGPCCPHSPNHPGPVSQLRKTGLSTSPTQWAWVRKWLQQGPPTEQVGPGAQLLLEAHSPGKCRSNHRDKLRRSPLQPAKPALHQPAASLGGGLPTAWPPGRRVGHEPVGEVSSQKEIQGGPRRGVVHVEGTYGPIQTSPS